MRFYAVLRISSLLIPLVNLTDLCKKFVTRWHTCDKTCDKSTIFQICLYETKLNGNNLNCIYNFRKFKLFPFVSVSLSNICVCCSYLPMQIIVLLDNQPCSILPVQKRYCFGIGIERKVLISKYSSSNFVMQI